MGGERLLPVECIRLFCDFNPFNLISGGPSKRALHCPQQRELLWNGCALRDGHHILRNGLIQRPDRDNFPSADRFMVLTATPDHRPLLEFVIVWEPGENFGNDMFEPCLKFLRESVFSFFPRVSIN